MSRIHKLDWSRLKMPKGQSVLIIFSHGQKASAFIAKKEEVSFFAQRAGDSALTAASAALNSLREQKKSLPKYCVIVTEESRLSTSSATIDPSAAPEISKRAVQFSVSELLDGLFTPGRIIANTFAGQFLSEEEFNQLESYEIDLSDEEQFLATAQVLQAEEKLPKMSSSDSQSVLLNDVDVAWQPLGDESTAVTVLPQAKANAWRGWAAEEKLEICAFISEPLAHLTAISNTGTVAYLDANVGWLSFLEDERWMGLEDYQRDQELFPAAWKESIDSQNELTTIIASEHDARSLCPDLTLPEEQIHWISRLNEHHLGQVAEFVLKQLRSLPELRTLMVHPAHQESPPIYHQLVFWQKAGALGALAAAVAMYFPAHLENKKGEEANKKLKTQLQFTESSIREGNLKMKGYEEAERKIDRLRRQLQSQQSSGKVLFFRSVNHLQFLDTLAESLAETPGIQIVSYETNWKGLITLAGSSNTMREARYFTDSFVQKLKNLNLPSHSVSLLQETETEMYQFSIKP